MPWAPCPAASPREVFFIVAAKCNRDLFLFFPHKSRNSRPGPSKRDAIGREKGKTFPVRCGDRGGRGVYGKTLRE